MGIENNSQGGSGSPPGRGISRRRVLAIGLGAAASLLLGCELEGWSGDRKKWKGWQDDVLERQRQGLEPSTPTPEE